MTVATITAEPDGPLSQSQQHQIAAAKIRARKIRKAAAVAGFNGWTTGILAVCSAPFALFGLPGLLITAGMSLVAFNEFQGRRRLLQFDGEAPAFLGWNQIGFLALIAAYCCWMLFVGLTSEGPFAAEFEAKPELRVAFDSVDEFDQYYRILMTVVYGTGIVLSVIFQGLNAIYYFTRQKHVQAYVQQTPAWVIDLQRLASPG
jgi:hypothetical protein